MYKAAAQVMPRLHWNTLQNNNDLSIAVKVPQRPHVITMANVDLEYCNMLHFMTMWHRNITQKMY